MGELPEYRHYGKLFSRDILVVDVLDKKILYVLSHNARFSITFLAKVLRTKRETILYRLKRMKEQKLLQGYLTLIDHRRLGLKNYLLYLKLHLISSEEGFVEYLLTIPEITRLKNCAGLYDFQLVVTAKNEEEFLTIFEKILGKYHFLLHHYEILEIVEEDFLGLGLLVPDNTNDHLNLREHKGSSFSKEFREVRTIKKGLDEKDCAILNLLKLDARLPISIISKKVNLAAVSVHTRIGRMVQSGVIKSFIPLISLQQLGYQWWKVFCTFTQGNKNTFITFCRQHHNILWYMRLLGKWQYQFSIFAKDNAEFHAILDDFKTTFRTSILHYEAVIVFNQFKYVQRIR